ncbi:MAG: MFS transporter [Actinomycetota bacterium]|nr:MFS transporter [Actinomycetota bacterium]
MRLLRQPRLALLFAGSALNEIGSWASLIAFWGYAAYRFHSSPDQIALVSVMWSSPGAVFSLMSGWPIDRFGPKAVMIAADVVGVGAALGMVWAQSYGTLVVMVLLAGTVSAFGRPAASSLPPRLADDEDLLLANSLLGLTTQLALVIGPLVASVAISLWSIRAAFVVDASTFVVGVITTLPLRLRPPVTPDPATATPTDLLAGLRLAWRIVTVRRTLLLGLALFCSWGASMVMEPLYVRDVLHRSGATFGWLQTIFGVGLIVTTLLLPRLGDRVVSVRAQAVSVLASAGAVVVYLASASLPAAAIGIFFWGMLTALFLPPFYTLLQRSTPPDSHGRVMATAAMTNGVAGLATTPLAAVLVTAFGVRSTALAVATGLLVAGAAGWLTDQGAAKRASRAAATAGYAASSAE